MFESNDVTCLPGSSVCILRKRTDLHVNPILESRVATSHSCARTQTDHAPVIAYMYLRHTWNTGSYDSSRERSQQQRGENECRPPARMHVHPDDACAQPGARLASKAACSCCDGDVDHASAASSARPREYTLHTRAILKTRLSQSAS